MELQQDQQLDKTFDELNLLYEKQLDEQKKLQQEQARIREEIKQRKELLKKNKSKLDYLSVKQKNSIKFQIGDLVIKSFEEQQNKLQVLKNIQNFLIEKQIIKQ